MGWNRGLFPCWCCGVQSFSAARCIIFLNLAEQKQSKNRTTTLCKFTRSNRKGKTAYDHELIFQLVMFVRLGSGLFGLWFQTFWVCCDWTRPICMRVALSDAELLSWVSLKPNWAEKLAARGSSAPKQNLAIFGYDSPLFWMLMTMTIGPRVWVEAATSWWRTSSYAKTLELRSWRWEDANMASLISRGFHRWFPGGFPQGLQKAKSILSGGSFLQKRFWGWIENHNHSALYISITKKEDAKGQEDRDGQRTGQDVKQITATYYNNSMKCSIGWL